MHCITRPQMRVCNPFFFVCFLENFLYFSPLWITTFDTWSKSASICSLRSKNTVMWHHAQITCWHILSYIKPFFNRSQGLLTLRTPESNQLILDFRWMFMPNLTNFCEGFFFAISCFEEWDRPEHIMHYREPRFYLQCQSFHCTTVCPLRRNLFMDQQSTSLDQGCQHLTDVLFHNQTVMWIYFTAQSELIVLAFVSLVIKGKISIYICLSSQKESISI